MDIVKIPSPNWRHGNNPKLLVLHYTAGTESGTIDEFLKPDSTSCHYIVAKNGVITQMVDEENKAFHAGRSVYYFDGIEHLSMNGTSIGIELENWGLLHKDSDHIIRRWTGAKHIGAYHYIVGNYWDHYTFTQMAMLVRLIKDILTRWPNLIIVGHSDISPGRKQDPGPALDINNILLEVEVEIEIT